MKLRDPSMLVFPLYIKFTHTDCCLLFYGSYSARTIVKHGGSQINLDHLSKDLSDLKVDNQRLKDENGALIRVISKLSK